MDMKMPKMPQMMMKAMTRITPKIRLKIVITIHGIIRHGLALQRSWLIKRSSF